MSSIRRAVLACAGAVLSLVAPSAASGQEELAPFTALRWRADAPQVRVNDVWYELVAIDDLEAAKIVAFARKTYPDAWPRRVGEDLVEVLEKMDHKPGPTVKLTVRRLDTGKTEVLDKVPMTEANRTAVWQSKLARELNPSRAQVKADIDLLERELESRYSYLTLKGVDYRTALDEIRNGPDEYVPRSRVVAAVRKLLARFGDGHTRVNAPELDDLPLVGYTPFLVGEAEGRLAVFHETRSGFLADDAPFLKRMDGVPVERWLEAARRIGPGGSPHFARSTAIRNLRYVQYLRSELGLKTADTLDVELESADGKQTRTLTVRVTPFKPTYGAWPRAGHRFLDGNIGYLRIESMASDPDFLRELREAMARFRETRGLVIDVRGNGGGSRAVVRELFPYFMKPDDPPRITNVAAYLLGPDEKAGAPEGYLENRFLYPLTSKEWSADDRAAIRRFAAGFKPEWPPPDGRFSDWHYFLLKPRPGPDSYHYDRPVVVLMDADCFSATDIFLGAFKGWRNVTLMGTASGGGSGRARRVILPNTPIELQMSSMASFQPDGKLYEGRGVSPDVEVRPVATDLIGKTDTVLDAARKRLR